MKLNVFAVLLTLAAACGFAACGGSVTGGSSGPAGDAGTTIGEGGMGSDAGAPLDAAPDVDHGQPSTTYPAFKPNVGQLVNNGGVVLHDPVIVSVTWQTDPVADQLEAFTDQLGASPYWKTAVGEYGINAATSGATNHVRIPVTMAAPVPSSLSDADLDALVNASAASPTTSMWPAPTDQTIYILYLHPSTSLNLGGDACMSGILGYHDETLVNGAPVAYAIVPRCTFHGLSALDATTETASHELGEAATDPHPQSAPAWIGFDDAHLSYEFFQQFSSENGDACEFFRDSSYKSDAPFAFQVQRLWSNVSAAAGHNPCLPTVTDAYFNVTPLSLESVTADLSRLNGPPSYKTTGIPIKVGETKTFPVGLYSDAPTNGPWTLKAVEGNPITPSKASHLKVSIDRTTGQNGDIAYVTVTVNSAGTTKAELVTVVSSNSSATHYMPILIGSM